MRYLTLLGIILVLIFSLGNLEAAKRKTKKKASAKTYKTSDIKQFINLKAWEVKTKNLEKISIGLQTDIKNLNKDIEDLKKQQISFGKTAAKVGFLTKGLKLYVKYAMFLIVIVIGLLVFREMTVLKTIRQIKEVTDEISHNPPVRLKKDEAGKSMVAKGSEGKLSY